MRANGSHRASNLPGNHHLRRLVVVAALTMVLIIPSSLVAAKKGGAQPGGEEPAGNNLSVPTYFVSTSNPFGVDCPSDAYPPTGDPDWGDFYLQGGESDWQADCKTSRAAVGVRAVWGDNLVNGRPFPPNNPIRIEMKLDTNRTGTGFLVVKLDDAVDRLAEYGTKGVPDDSMAYMVWGPGEDNLAICPDRACDNPTEEFTMRAEVNSTGKVVYGYSLRLERTGTYLLRFTPPSGVTIGSVNGSSNTEVDDEGAYVTIQVGRDGGGGKKGGNH